jgi:hypothetical protein
MILLLPFVLLEKITTEMPGYYRYSNCTMLHSKIGQTMTWPHENPLLTHSCLWLPFGHPFTHLFSECLVHSCLGSGPILVTEWTKQTVLFLSSLHSDQCCKSFCIFSEMSSLFIVKYIVEVYQGVHSYIPLATFLMILYLISSSLKYYSN